MVRWTTIAVALALVLTAPASAARGRAATGGDFRFADIPPNHWAVDHIRRVTSAGLMQGYEGRFLGNTPVNRYQMAQILSRMMDRMGQMPLQRESHGASNEVVLQIADEVANLNVAQSNLEEKVVQLRHDVEAIKQGEGHGDGARETIRKIDDDEWRERVRTQAPAGFLALAIFASAGMLKSK
jgi:outer membrane murein-binding lipoprotein Lpp